MTAVAPVPVHIRRTLVERMATDCAPVIAIGLETRTGRQHFFSITDSDAYALIRQMTDVLFAAEDPPRSGVGSPEASVGSAADTP
jgi:hypothetical protein